nr:reverse transcriptase domain-containing protein [Tanacetum cinerariifolium]
QKASPAIVEPLRIENPFLEGQFQEDPPKDPPEVPMTDNRTMAEMLRAPTEGYAEAIIQKASPAIVEPLRIENPFLEGQFQEDPPKDPPEVPMTDNRTMAEMLRAPTEGYAAAIIGQPAGGLKKNPRILSPHGKILSQSLLMNSSPSRTTSLRNEISNFEQKFGESFHEAWDRYKDLLRACPHHGFTELHQLNTFYNALNHTDQDSLNAAIGGNLLERKDDIGSTEFTIYETMKGSLGEF